MIKRFCDRCKKEIAPKDDFYKFDIRYGMDNEAYELCYKCGLDFEEVFVRGNKKR